MIQYCYEILNNKKDEKYSTIKLVTCNYTILQ